MTSKDYDKPTTPDTMGLRIEVMSSGAMKLSYLDDKNKLVGEVTSFKEAPDFVKELMSKHPLKTEE